MLRRPSSRRKTEAQQISINLVPMLDALVTLVAFLLFSTAFLAVAVIDTPAPVLAPADTQIEKLKDKPLQLTAYIQENQILVSDWSGSRENHAIPNVPDQATGESRYDIEAFHRTLIEIKNRHPGETKLILKPDPGVAYETIVGVMDSARYFDKTDPPLYLRAEQEAAPGSPTAPAPGTERPEKNLFNEVIFGNVLS